VISPVQYPQLTEEELVRELCSLTADLIGNRKDHANLAVAVNRDFYQVFLDAEGESVASRNRLAEAATRTLEQERIGVEANIACIEDLISLVRCILDRR
jgi:hypothetical protein